MLKFTSCLMLVAALSTTSAYARTKVIYGADNRVDVADSVNFQFQDYAQSTAAMIEKSKLVKKEDRLTLSTGTLQEEFNVCTTERFYDQPAAAYCSGFLVAPDLLVTAGHCVIPAAMGGDQCERFSWVFDYRSDVLDLENMDDSKIYNCAEVLHHELDSEKRSDFALIRLDRPVSDRPFLNFRKEGKVETGSELVVIGHPSGLPTKISDGATVQDNSSEQFFTSDLDTYGGNSGSAVINVSTGEVEGILVRGATDYVRTQEGCIVSNRCSSISPFGCGGEGVSRITLVDILSHLQTNPEK